MSKETSPGEPRTETQILAAATKFVNENVKNYLKLSVEVEKNFEVLKKQGERIDAILKLVNNSQIAKFAVEVKKVSEMRDLLIAANHVNEIVKKYQNYQPMIVARYLSQPAQKWLREQQISYADATGNFMVTSPATSTLLISDSGAKSDPWRQAGRPRNTLKGVTVAQVIRALVETKPPYSITNLCKLAEASSGVVYRTIDYLDRENLITIEKIKKTKREISLITDVKWREIIQAWSNDYSFTKNNSVSSYLEPRGIEEVIKKLKKIDSSIYAVTGSVAAAQYEKYAESKQIRIYAKNPDQIVAELGLREVDSGMNVQIAATDYESVFKNTSSKQGFTTVSLPQIAVDLLSGPGRNPSEGEALLDWMSKNEKVWRRK